jgi:hypothetical protein
MYADKLRERGNLSATRLLHLAHPLLTYVRSNKSAIINYGARYRSGRRIATALAEPGANSLVAHGQSEAPIFCFRFGRPFLTAIFGSAQVQAAETSQSVENRVDVQTYTTAAQVRIVPLLI